MNSLLSPVHLLLPVHNRREITLRGLRHLRATGVDAWARIVVIDDGSVDGTADAVRAEFPAATVLPGDGNLFWTGAIALGMRHAMVEGTTCCVWLNDDSHPVPGAIERVVRRALADGAVVSGAGRFVGEDGQAEPLEFHALRRTRWGLYPDSAARDPVRRLILVDACRGNLVAIPRQVAETIGYPDAAHLPQYLGDTDYTLRVTAAGFACIVDLDAVVEERARSGNWDDSWLLTDRPLRWIWARFGQKGASLYWRANWTYRRRHWGWWRGPLLFAAPYARLALISVARLLVPRGWLRRWRRA